MKPVDTKPLRAAIRDTAISLYKSGVTSPVDFVARFHVEHDDLCSDFSEYGFDQFLKTQGKTAMKRVGRDIGDSYVDGQLSFDGIAEDLEIPSILPVRRNNGDHEWVPLRSGSLEDGNHYRDMLEANIQACTKLATDWGVFWGVIQPHLERNPDWTIGDAIKAELGDDADD